MNSRRWLRHLNIFWCAVSFLMASQALASASTCASVLLTPQRTAAATERSITDLARLRLEMDLNSLQGQSKSISTDIVAKNYPHLFQNLLKESGLAEAELKSRILSKVRELQRQRTEVKEASSRRTLTETEMLTVSFTHTSTQSLPFAISSTNGFFEYLPREHMIIARAPMATPLLRNKAGAATISYDLAKNSHQVIQEKSHLASLLSDGKTVLSLGQDGKLIFFDLFQGKEVRSVQTEFLDQLNVESWALSADESLLAFNRRNQIVVIELDSGKIIAQSSTNFLNSPQHAKKLVFSSMNELLIHDQAKGLARFTVSTSAMKFLLEGNFATAVFDDLNQSVMLTQHMSTKYPGQLLNLKTGQTQALTKYLGFSKNIDGTKFHFARAHQSNMHAYGVYLFGSEHPLFEIDRPELISQWSGPKGIEITNIASKGEHFVLFHRERSDLTKGTLEFYKKK